MQLCDSSALSTDGTGGIDDTDGTDSIDSTGSTGSTDNTGSTDGTDDTDDTDGTGSTDSTGGTDRTGALTISIITVFWSCLSVYLDTGEITLPQSEWECLRGPVRKEYDWMKRYWQRIGRNLHFVHPIGCMSLRLCKLSMEFYDVLFLLISKLYYDFDVG